MGRPMLPSPMKPTLPWSCRVRFQLPRAPARRPASGAKYAATSSGVTSDNRSGRQRGRLSLSMISARTPSEKSCPAMKRWTSRYSRRMAASKSRVCAGLQLPEGDREAGRRLAAELLELGPSPTGRLGRERAEHILQASAGRSSRRSAPARPAARPHPDRRRSRPAPGRPRQTRRRTDRPRRARPRAPRAGRPARWWVREPGRQAVGRAEARAGEPEIHAEAAGQARQHVGRADVREQADAGLRHREHRALGHHAVRAVHRDPDAAAHRDAVEQRDVGLGEMVQPRIHRVLDAHRSGPRRRRPRAVSTPCSQRMSPPAQNARSPAPLISTARTSGSACQLRQPGRERPAHRQRERVERARPVQGDHHQAAPALEPDLVVRRSCRQPASRRRAMITRMISLVPSRI